MGEWLSHLSALASFEEGIGGLKYMSEVNKYLTLVGHDFNSRRKLLVRFSSSSNDWFQLQQYNFMSRVEQHLQQAALLLNIALCTAQT